MYFIPIGFSIVVLVLMLVVLALQDATRYTGSDRFADLLSDAGFLIIFVFLLVGVVFRFQNYHRSRYLFWGLPWCAAAFGCWWLFFRDDSRDPPKK